MSKFPINVAGLPEQGADPAAAANEGMLYSKDAAGVTQLFFRASDGTVYQITPPSGGSVPVLQNLLFVAPNGNDGTGDGSVAKPFLTIAAAQAAVVGATPANPWGIVVTAPMAEANVVMKPNVFLVGMGAEITKITAAFSLDTTFTAADITGFMNLTADGTFTADFVTPNMTGQLRAWNSIFTGAVTYTAQNSVNWYTYNTTFENGLQQRSGQLFLQSTVVLGAFDVGNNAAFHIFDMEAEQCTFTQVNIDEQTDNDIVSFAECCTTGSFTANSTSEGIFRVVGNVEAFGQRPVFTGNAVPITRTANSAFIWNTDTNYESARSFSNYDELMQAIGNTPGAVTVLLKTDINVNSATVYDWSRIQWEADDKVVGRSITFTGDTQVSGSISIGDGLSLINQNATKAIRAAADGIIVFGAGCQCYKLPNDGTAPGVFEVNTNQWLHIAAGGGFTFGTLVNVLGAGSDLELHFGDYTSGLFPVIGPGVDRNLTCFSHGARTDTGGYANQQASFSAAVNNVPANVPFISRDTMTGNKNDYLPDYFREAGKVFLDPNGVNRTISGWDATPQDIDGGTYACVDKLIMNISTTNTITLQNQNVGSAAANRMQTQTNADIVIPTRGAAILSYDDVAQRWRAFLCNS